MIEARAPEMMIPVEDSFAAWRNDLQYVEAYTALEDEFSLAATVIKAQADVSVAVSKCAARN